MALVLVLMMLAAWRATHLVVADDFPPVRWARRRIAAAGPEWLADLVTCTYCAGVWVAGAIVAATAAVVDVAWPWLAFGAVAAAVPIVDAVVERLEREPAVTPPAPPQPTTYTGGRRG